MSFVVLGTTPDTQPEPEPGTGGTPGTITRVPPRERLMATYTSWTGSSWTLTDNRSPVFVLQEATGLRGAPVEHWWSDAARLNGSTWEGLRIARGEIFLPIRIDGDSATSFLATHDEFSKSLHPRHESTLRITRPNGQWREIACRYRDGMDSPIGLDPVMMRRASYGITWETADPFWRGEPIQPKVFTYQVPKQRFPGPPYYINPGQTLDRAKVTNPGDEDIYPVWRVTGPFTSFSVGVGDAVVAMSLTKGAGRWVEIDMRPGRATIVDDAGVDQWLATTARKFAPIPPGTDIPVVTSVAGASEGTQVSLTIEPKYTSAL